MARDKVALVTGASSGIGEHTCRELARRGFTVYAAARRVERMRPLEQFGVRVLGMDLTDDASMVGGVERILAEQGRLDVLVNNAGYASYGAVEDVPLADARQQFEVNLFGMGRLIQLAAPPCARRAAAGSSTCPDRRRLLRAARRLVPRGQICGGRFVGQPPGGAQTVRHRRGDHRTRADPDRVELDRVDQPAAELGGDGLPAAGREHGPDGLRGLCGCGRQRARRWWAAGSPASPPPGGRAAGTRWAGARAPS